MYETGVLLENVLNEIENRIKEDINADYLADNLGISSVHLQRLFRFAFKQPIGAYIRSRKLTESLEDLLSTNNKLLSIALDYGFEYEQSFLRAFKQEFGITPGIYRRTHRIVKVTPPINLIGAKLFENGIMFEPEVVMIPHFHIIGRNHKIPHNKSISIAPKVAKLFWENDRDNMLNIIDSNVYFGLTRTSGADADYSWYMPSIQVKSLKDIPEGLEGYTFNRSLCVKFRYIGEHHYYEINRNRAKRMYSAIEKFFDCEYGQRFSKINGVYFEKIDTKLYDGRFCQMEWFAPIKKIRND
jgi:AraC family transcriptional regulator